MRSIAIYAVMALFPVVSSAAQLLYTVNFNSNLPATFFRCDSAVINNSDQIAFVGNGANRQDVVIANSAGWQSIFFATSTQPTGHIDGTGQHVDGLSINSSAHIAFNLSAVGSSTTYGGYFYSGGVLTSIYQDTSGKTMGAQSLNDADDVVLGNWTQFQLWKNGVVTNLAVAPNSRGVSGAIDDNGNVFYTREIVGPSPRTFESRALTSSADLQFFAGTNASTTGGFAINDLGGMVYRYSDKLYLSTLVNPTPSPLLSGLANVYGVSINDHNDVVYSVLAGGSNNYIYYLKAGTTNPIALLKVGDAFLGSTLSSFSLSNGSLNDLGHLAVNYQLANGMNGVAVIAVPESQSVHLLAGIILGGLLLRFRVLRRS